MKSARNTVGARKMPPIAAAEFCLEVGHLERMRYAAATVAGIARRLCLALLLIDDSPARSRAASHWMQTGPHRHRESGKGPRFELISDAHGR
jgi:hypothetical protein